MTCEPKAVRLLHRHGAVPLKQHFQTGDIRTRSLRRRHAAVLSVSALAANAANIGHSIDTAFGNFHPMSAKTVQLIPLQDGFTIHKNQDGKMALENPYGRPVLAKSGQTLLAVDGSSITMVGNEVARLSAEMRTVNHR